MDKSQNTIIYICTEKAVFDRTENYVNAVLRSFVFSSIRRTTNDSVYNAVRDMIREILKYDM